MNDNQFDSPLRRNRSAARKLADDLGRLDNKAGPASTGDIEVLSLMIDEVSRGVDITKRYPSFYQKLLSNPALRRTFLDLLESVEDDQENSLTPEIEAGNADMSFLINRRVRPETEKSPGKWKIRWQKTIDELQAMFLPSRLVYRADPLLSEDPWFVILRDEAEVDGIRYASALECTLADRAEPALSPFLNIAVTAGIDAGRVAFPIQATLQWGSYNETVEFSDEGRMKFPDVAYPIIFDQEEDKIISGITLTIEPVL